VQAVLRFGARLLLAAGLLGGAATVHAQEWAVDLYAGRALYEPVSANVGATSLIGGIRYGSPATWWFYTAAAAPLDDTSPTWGSLGASGRIPVAGGRRWSAGLDVGAHGYAYRDAVAELNGAGATLEAGAFLGTVLAGGIGAGPVTGLRAELRAGRRDYLASDAGVRTTRDGLDGALRLETMGAVRAGAGLRVVRVAEGEFTAATADLAASMGPVRLWLSGERWLDSGLDDLGWSVTASVPVGFVEAWGAYRHDVREPLYWNPARQSWSVGLTRRFGAAPARLNAPVAEIRAGRALIRLPRSTAATGVSVAGDFSSWKPQPMQAAGAYWQLDIPLRPGVYRYAFVDPAGRWFVPEGVAGRMDDGMGGHVAVLVVP
jgi:hypothetical protein